MNESAPTQVKHVTEGTVTMDAGEMRCDAASSSSTTPDPSCNVRAPIGLLAELTHRCPPAWHSGGPASKLASTGAPESTDASMAASGSCVVASSPASAVTSPELELLELLLLEPPPLLDDDDGDPLDDELEPIVPLLLDDVLSELDPARAEARLGDTGRVLLRPSGTEQLVRVMVEAPTIDEARAVAAELSAVVAAG